MNLIRSWVTDSTTKCGKVLRAAVVPFAGHVTEKMIDLERRLCKQSDVVSHEEHCEQTNQVEDESCTDKR